MTEALFGTLGFGAAGVDAVDEAVAADEAVAVDVEVTVTSGVGVWEADAAGLEAGAGTAFVASSFLGLRK